MIAAEAHGKHPHPVAERDSRIAFVPPRECADVRPAQGVAATGRGSHQIVKSLTDPSAYVDQLGREDRTMQMVGGRIESGGELVEQT